MLRVSDRVEPLRSKVLPSAQDSRLVDEPFEFRIAIVDREVAAVCDDGRFGCGSGVGR